MYTHHKNSGCKKVQYAPVYPKYICFHTSFSKNMFYYKPTEKYLLISTSVIGGGCDTMEVATAPCQPGRLMNFREFREENDL